MADELSGIALVTGGGRGIGAAVARELAAAGMKVAVAARSADQVRAMAEEIGGLPVVVDVSSRESVAEMIDQVETELGGIDLLVANAGISGPRGKTWEVDPARWWQTHEVNVLGVFLCCRAVIPRMIERSAGRIVITASGAAYLPGSSGTAYSSSKAAVNRFGETLANELRPHGIPVFPFSPGLVRSEMTKDVFSDDAPWTPPQLAPQLVRVLASGRADKLSGRYLHAEHDDIEDLISRADEIVENDLNAIRLQR
ncbi:MAG TPA: SDR family oxidoreductase [Gaiellaceae bacterium]|nr:SDR family oxidoreductase [Gaiellaceae bacterium]